MCALHEPFDTAKYYIALSQIYIVAYLCGPLSLKLCDNTRDFVYVALFLCLYIDRSPACVLQLSCLPKCIYNIRR